MRLLTFIKTINLTKLDGELRAALSTAIDGISYDGHTVSVVLTVAADDTSDDAQVTALVNAHDPSATADQNFVVINKPLVTYFRSIILSLYQDVDNGGVTLVQMLNNAAAIVGTNATQAAKFNAYRTRLGLGGAINTLTATQQGNLLVLGLEWAGAGLAVALSS